MVDRRFRRAEYPPRLSPDWVVDQSIIDCGWYAGGVRVGGKLTVTEAAQRAAQGEDGFAWIGLYGPSEAQMAHLARLFDLHPLAAEDAVHAHQRPKIEWYRDTVFLTMKTVRVNDVPVRKVRPGSTRSARSHQAGPGGTGRPAGRGGRARTNPSAAMEEAEQDVEESGEIMVFAGPRFVITVRHGEAVALDPVRKRIEADPRVVASGPLGVLYGIADLLVDRYVVAADELEGRITRLEEMVFAREAPKVPLQRVYLAKRSVVVLKRSINPLVRPLTDWVRASGNSGDDLSRYLSDVLDHLQRAQDQVGSSDEAITTLVQAHLMRTREATNTHVRMISAWAAIIAVPTLIGGVYGMNFENMPGLSSRYGFAVTILCMATVCLALWSEFRRNGWL